MEDTLFRALEELAEALSNSHQGRVRPIMESYDLMPYEAMILRAVTMKKERPNGPGFDLLFNKDGGKVAMEGLVKKGFVVMNEATGKYESTEKGMQVHKEVEAARTKFRENVCSDFSEDDVKEMVAYLQKLRVCVEKY